MRTVKFSAIFVIVVSAIMLLFGLFMFITFLSLKTPIGDPIFGHLYSNENVAEGTNVLYSSLSAILGGVTISWCVYSIVLAYRIIKEKRGWIINLLLTTLIIWYCSDTFASYYYGIMANVVFNTFFFLLEFIPLLIIKLQMRKLATS